MKAPTWQQQKVLSAIANRGRILTAIKISADERRAGAAGASNEESLRHHSGVRRALIDVARAGAIPTAWIEHATRAGDRGLLFDLNSPLPEPGPVAWDSVLGKLGTQVRRLQHWAALSAAHTEFRIPGTGHLAAGIGTNLRILHAHTTGIANLLGIDAALGHELWGSERDWAHAGAATIEHSGRHELTAHWTRTAHAATTLVSQHAAALANAGITVTASPAVPALETLLPALARELRPAQPTFSDSGHAIDNAVAAAMTSHETHDSRATFSHSDDVEPYSGQPAWADPPRAPTWQEPGR